MNGITTYRLLKGLAVALVSFGGLGTVAALWENPIFIRMTPAGGWEVALLGLLALLLGVYVAIRRPACSLRGAGVGGTLGFLGVACPICNKLLVLAFGADLLLAYFEPIRLYATLGGVLLIGVIVLREWHWRAEQVRTAGPDAPGTAAS
jgi:hypothetical protein